MFTLQEKAYVLEALIDKKTSVERSKAKAKHPEFAPLYDKILSDLAAIVMKVQAVEATDGKGKVASRPQNG